MTSSLPESGIDPKLYQQLYAFEYIQVISLGVFAWELIATLPMEVALYRKGFKATLLLLSISRYYTLLCVIVSVALNLTVGPTSKFCHDVRWILPFLSTTIQFVSMPLLFLRTYAIWGKNKGIAFILLIGLIGPLVIGTYICTTYDGVPYSALIGLDVVAGCGNDPTNNWGTAPFISNMIVDSIVLLLTIGRLLFLNSITHSSIRSLLLRDGIIYYVVVVAINVVNIVFFLAPGLPPLARPLIATPATIAPAIMVGRLYFNLQYSFLSPHGSQPSDPLFNSKRPLGNISLESNPKRLRDRNIIPLTPLNVAYSIDVKSDGSIPNVSEEHPYSNALSHSSTSQSGSKHPSIKGFP